MTVLIYVDTSKRSEIPITSRWPPRCRGNVV